MSLPLRLLTCAAVSISLYTASASANSYHYCSGTVGAVWVESHGGVQISGSWRNDHTKICNINGNWNGVDKEVCKAWLSQVQIAKASGKEVTLRYSSNTVESCSQIPNYSGAPAPHYVMLK